MPPANATACPDLTAHDFDSMRGQALARPAVLRQMGAMSSHATAVRAIDHLVLPTSGLHVARARLSALGFTVAPEGVHPFGTVNACVYFADGTFLEPLAVGDPSVCAAAAEAGNVFVARDRAYRAAFGEEGFSAIVLATPDAEADHEAYVENGCSAGAMLSFSRPFTDASGRSDMASFRLAFAAAAGTAPFLFACERVNAPDVDRSALTRHANGALGIAAVDVAAADPARAAGLIAAATGAAGRAAGNGVRFALPRGAIVVRDPDEGEAPTPDAAFDFRAVTFPVADLAALGALLAGSGIGHHLSGGRIVVPTAPGQGAIFIFEERA
jgi:hypothetical protein